MSRACHVHQKLLALGIAPLLSPKAIVDLKYSIIICSGNLCRFKSGFGPRKCDHIMWIFVDLDGLVYYNRCVDFLFAFEIGRELVGEH